MSFSYLFLIPFAFLVTAPQLNFSLFPCLYLCLDLDGPPAAWHFLVALFCGTKLLSQLALSNAVWTHAYVCTHASCFHTLLKVLGKLLRLFGMMWLTFVLNHNNSLSFLLHSSVKLLQASTRLVFFLFIWLILCLRISHS